MRAGETRILVLVVIGSAPEEVLFSGTDLPRFATLEGPILTLAPQRPDKGEYLLTLTAASGKLMQSENLDVVVDRLNSPPSWGPGLYAPPGWFHGRFGNPGGVS